MMRKYFLALMLALLPIVAHAQGISGTSQLTTTPIVLTDGSSITVPCPSPTGSTTYYLTLTGNNHQIAFPTCSTLANGSTVRFRITAGNNSGSPYSGLSFAPGFNWTGGSTYAYGLCTAASTPDATCLAAALANNKDEVGCDVIGTVASPVQWDCWIAQRNILAPFLLANAQGTCTAASGGCTTSAINMTGANLIIACSNDYNSGGQSVLSDSSSNSYTSIFDVSLAGAAAFHGRMYYVYAPTVTSSMTFALSTNDVALAVIGFRNAVSSPLDQNANANSGTSSTVTSQAPTSITPTLANELVVECLTIGFDSPTGLSIAAPFTIGPNVPAVSGVSEGVYIAYQVQTDIMAVNPTWSWTGSTYAIAGQASFK